MNDSLLRRLLAAVDADADGLALPAIADALRVPPADAERAVRMLLRAGRLRRRHRGPGDLRYAAVPAPEVPAAPLPAAAPGAARTLTARVLAVLQRQQAPLRAAEVVLLAGLAEDARTVSRVSATLCMLARRGRLRREPLAGGAVRYALPGTPAATAPSLRPGDLIEAGFRPTIPREVDSPLLLAEWLPSGATERPSAATICQRLRRGWPPELAVALPPLRRQVA